MDVDVGALKYLQLRSLAKELGLKSNIKAEKLRKILKQHYDDKVLQEEEQEEQEEQQEVNGNDGDVMDVQQDDLDSTQEDVCEGREGSGGVGASEEKEKEEQSGPGRSLFVTSRRGKKRSPKRKMSDVETAAGRQAAAKPPPLATAEEVPAEVEGARAKRRRVSATTEPGPSKQQAGVKGDGPKVERAGKIPRHQGLLKKGKTPMAPITPNFKKLHEAHFKMMESIDSYVQRKTKQMEALKTSAQDLKVHSEKTLPKPTEGKKPPLVKRSRVSPRSLVSLPKPPRAGRASQKETADFRPSVLSTRRINVRFSEATLDNEPKKSLLKTPIRMSTPGRRSVTNVSIAKSPEAFVFTGDNSFSTSTTPVTNKPGFDLKASLSKPLSYKPHKGKLKPFAETKENAAVNNNNSVVQSSHQKNYKQHQVQTREQRRFKQTQDRKQKKESALGARRGLVMS